jgi:hypothetical protein
VKLKKLMTKNTLAINEVNAAKVNYDVFYIKFWQVSKLGLYVSGRFFNFDNIFFIHANCLKKLQYFHTLSQKKILK